MFPNLRRLILAQKIQGYVCVFLFIVLCSTTNHLIFSCILFQWLHWQWTTYWNVSRQNCTVHLHSALMGMNVDISIGVLLGHDIPNNDILSHEEPGVRDFHWILHGSLNGEQQQNGKMQHIEKSSFLIRHFCAKTKYFSTFFVWK